MSWSSPSRHLSSETLLATTSSISHLWRDYKDGVFFSKKNGPFCYLSHPEVLFKHWCSAFPGFNPSCALWPGPSSVPIKLIPSLSPPLTPSQSSYQEMSIWLSDLWPGRTEVRAGCHNLRRWEKKTTSDIWENWGCIFLTQYVYGWWVTWSLPQDIFLSWS